MLQLPISILALVLADVSSKESSSFVHFPMVLAETIAGAALWRRTKQNKTKNQQINGRDKWEHYESSRPDTPRFQGGCVSNLECISHLGKPRAADHQVFTGE